MENPPPDSESHDPDSSSSSEASEMENQQPEAHSAHTTPATLNPQYANLFNEHVTSFFKLEYLDTNSKTRSTDTRLHPSKNTLDAAYYVPRDSRRKTVPKSEDHDSQNPASSDQVSNLAAHADTDETENLPGTYWSAKEKEMFFECLARFSIHRIDEFLPFFAEKSRVEIEAYYHLLKRELRRVSKYKTYKAFFKDDKGHRHRTSYTMRVFERGTTYSKIPAAYEVDDLWMDFEEQQSHLLANQESARVNSSSFKQASILHAYKEDGPGENVSLINADAAHEISHIYRANHITPSLPAKKTPRLSFSSLVFFDELVKMRVRDLVMALIVSKGRSIGNAEVADILRNGESGENDENAIERSDVWRATEELRLFETKKAGFNSRYRDGKTPVMGFYWHNVVQSLQLQVNDRNRYVTPRMKIFEQKKGKYSDTDFFLRPIDKHEDGIEIPDALLDYMAPSDSGESGESGQSETGNDALSWDLPAPWDLSDSDVESGPGENGACMFGETLAIGEARNEVQTGPSDETSPSLANPENAGNLRNIATENGQSSNLHHISSSDAIVTYPHGTEKRVHADSASAQRQETSKNRTPKAPHKSTHQGSRKTLHFSELPTWETFSRKRFCDDILIEENLDEDVTEHTEAQDRKRAQKFLKMAKDEMGLKTDDTREEPEKRKTYMTRSLVHRFWEKSFASY